MVLTRTAIGRALAAALLLAAGTLTAGAAAAEPARRPPSAKTAPAKGSTPAKPSASAKSTAAKSTAAKTAATKAAPGGSAKVPVKPAAEVAPLCDKPTRADAFVICGDPELSRLHGQVAQRQKALTAALEAASDRARPNLGEELRRWPGVLGESCGITAAVKVTDQNRDSLARCLGDALRDRLRWADFARASLEFAGRLASHQFTERNTLKKYDIALRFPILRDRSTDGAPEFNAAIKGFIAAQADLFRTNYAAEDLDDGTPGGTPGGTQGELSSSFELYLASPRLISVGFPVLLRGPGAQQGARMNFAINFDLASRKPLLFEDIFAADTGWRTVAVEHCVAELNRRSRAEGWKLPDDIGDRVAAVVDNIAKWHLEATRAVITFDAYSVAGAASGEQRVAVPYRLLDGHFRADGPLPPIR